MGARDLLALDEVRALRNQTGGDVVVIGSGRLVHALLRDELVDELRLVVFPVVAGSGVRLFDDAVPSLCLAGSETVGHDLVRLTYRPGPPGR